MAELKPMEVIMRIDFAGSDREQICAHAEKVQELVRCKDCKWWDDKEGSGIGYCHAAKHGYWSEHWEISIYRTYKGDFFCADAERRSDG